MIDNGKKPRPRKCAFKDKRDDRSAVFVDVPGFPVLFDKSDALTEIAGGVINRGYDFCARSIDISVASRVRIIEPRASLIKLRCAKSPIRALIVSISDYNRRSFRDIPRRIPILFK